MATSLIQGQLPGEAGKKALSPYLGSGQTSQALTPLNKEPNRNHDNKKNQ